MPKITFLNNKNTFEVEEGTTILEVAERNGISLDHACGGFGACSTCHVYVRSGMENLSELTDEEADRLDDAEGVSLESRLGCQCKIRGDAVVEIP